MSATRPLPTAASLLAALFALLALTRLPLAPEHLFYFDSVNAAYALDEFDPRLHKPQPPGYPVYIALCRLIRAFGFSPEGTFVASGILAGLLTGWLLWRFGRELGRERAGWYAAILFVFTPVFWFNSLTNQGRGYSAVASAGAAWLCWRAADARAGGGRLALAAAFLGLMAGLRPAESAMLAPLLLWAAWKRRASPSSVGLAVVAGAIPIVVWGWFLMHACGGWTGFWEMMADYSANQRLRPSADPSRPWLSLVKAFEWVGAMHLVTFLPWAPALAFARPRLSSAGGFSFLAAWLAPGLAFQLFVHAADPCHSLATIAGLCWLGGLTLDGLPARRAFAALATACALSAALFFSPLVGAARATSYSVIRRTTQAVDEAIAIVRQERLKGHVTIVVKDSIVTWRHMTYYFPESEVWAEYGDRRWNPSDPRAGSEHPSGRVVLLEYQKVTVLDRGTGPLP